MLVSRQLWFLICFVAGGILYGMLFWCAWALCKPDHRASSTRQTLEEADGNNERTNLGFGRSLKRAWARRGSSLNLAHSESIRPRVGGKLGNSFRSIRSLYSERTDNTGLECKEQIGEGTCGIVFRALYNGRQVAAKMIKRVEQYEEQRTCPVDAKASFTRFVVLCRRSNYVLLCVNDLCALASTPSTP